MLKLINVNASHFIQREDYDSSHIENFESLVDLFTLLSFVLIISAILFGYQRLERSTNLKTTIDFREVEYATAPPVGIPENTLVIIIAVHNDRDLIYLVERGESPEIIYYSGMKKSLWSLLEEKKRNFMESEDIQIIVDNSTKRVNADLFLMIQNWLARYSFEATINFNSEADEIQ